MSGEGGIGVEDDVGLDALVDAYDLPVEGAGALHQAFAREGGADIGGIGDLGGGIGARCFRFDGVDGAGRAGRGGAIGRVVVAAAPTGGNDQDDRGDRAEKNKLAAQGEGGSRGITIDT